MVVHGGLTTTEDWQKEMITAEVEIRVDAEVDPATRQLTSPGRVVSTVRPARWWYFQLPEQPTTEVARYMTAGADVYVSMQTVDMTTGWTQMRVFYNPLVNWIWLGTSVMLFGCAVCIGTRRKEREESHV